MNDLERMKELVALLKKASRLYYQESTEMMSNLEYDRLYDELSALEEKLGVTLSDSPTVKVGYEIVSALPKKAHAAPMLSLNKTKSVEELQAFLGSQNGLLSWKMDGLTVVLSYDHGTLQEALTRGNGEEGEIITGNARSFLNVPLSIPFKGKLVLRGEAVINYDDFDEINASLPEGEEKYRNPRNLCAGSVRQLDSRVTAGRRVRFNAFALVEAEGVPFRLRREQMDWMKAQGFDVVFSRFVTAETLPEAVEAFSREISSCPTPSDGLVLLMDDIAYGNSLGRTAKFPRNALAFKWADELETTHLKDIEWSASRTGLINPVAIFDTVELEGTSVSRASVHNLTILEELALGYGDEITVYKANMIIPQIQENRTRSGSVRPPACCPACGSPTQIRDENGVRTLRCSNPGCPARQIKSFDLFVSREALNVEGLSESTLEKLVDLGIVRNFSDLFRLEEHRDAILELEGFGEKKLQNLLDALEKARHTQLSRLITALGISGIGPAGAKLICRYFGGELKALREATAEEYAKIEGIGAVTAESIVSYFSDPEHSAALDLLMDYIELIPEEQSAAPRNLEGKTIVITGSLTHFENRDALKKIIENHGGRVSGSVSGNTDYLINNDAASQSSKNKTARKLGIPVLTEEEAIRRFDLMQEEV